MTLRPLIRRVLVTSLAGALLSACAVANRVGDIMPFGNDDEEEDVGPTDGRIPVLTAEQVFAVDPEAAGPVAIPGPYVNASWPQTGGAPSHAMQHPNISGLSRAWRRDIGEGDGRNSRITAQPVVEGGRIFVMDGGGKIVALDAETGARRWTRELRVRGRRDKMGFGGGLAVAGGRLYVASGLGLMVALDPQDGRELWRVDTAVPLHSAPTVADGRIFVITDDNVLITFDAENGDQLWTYQGLPEPARMLTSPAPAVLGNIVVAPFGSGELVALQTNGGTPIWPGALTRAGRLAPIATLNDIAGSPVIYDGVVYAMSHSGVLAAIALDSGTRQWTQPAGGVNAPWLAGDVLFIVTGDAELAAIDRATGAARWIAQMPAFEKEERRRDRISWAGPVLAGGRLIVVPSDGDARIYDPIDGTLLGTFNPGKTFVSPIVANGTLYVLNSDGELSAYR